jgi:hypothetical protein
LRRNTRFRELLNTMNSNLHKELMMKLRHKGHLNTRNNILKEVFPKSMDFPSDFGSNQKLGFGDELMKS